MLIRIFKNWTLPISMLTGTLAYFVLGKVALFAPMKPGINHFLAWAPPCLIFLQLLLTFCKIEVRDLKPRIWHAWHLIFQFSATLLVALVLMFLPMNEFYRVFLEGIMVCLICPTATAAAVITNKLGGSAATLTTYTLLSNLLAAIMVPLLFPLIEPQADITFLAACWKILSKVFPLLLFPFLLACFFKAYLPRLHRFLKEFSGAAFYLWAIALAIVTGQTIRSMVNSTAPLFVLGMIGVGAMIACAVQFYLGKRIGGHYYERISGGQALGQKNTILAIWMAYTYLNPLASLAPGTYVLWQNIVNSYQLWKKRK